MMGNGQAWQVKIPEILGQDQIEPALSSVDANALLDEGHFQRYSVLTVDSSSSDEVSQGPIPSHPASRHSTDPLLGCPLPVVDSENIPDPKCESESRRTDKLIRSKNLRGMPRMQILNPKPDSEVSAETRRRRAVKGKKRAQRQRDEENRQKRVRNLETKGVESNRPCDECQSRGRQCIIEALQPSSTLDTTSESVSGALRSNLPSLPSSATHESKCVPPSPAPRRGSNLTLPCSACREHRTRCQKTRNGPDGPCDACCDREDKAMGIRHPRKLNVSQKCLDCIKHKRFCNFPPGDTEAVIAQNHQLRSGKDIKHKRICNFPPGDTEAVIAQNHRFRSGKDINSFPVYSKDWYYTKSRSEQKKILQHLVDTLDPYLRSGMARPGGPCTRCLSLGLKCMVIKPGSKASTLSPKTIRCSNCLGDVGSRIAGPWKVIRDCCPAEEGQILSITAGRAASSDSQSSEPSSGVQTTKIPLKDADDGNATQLQEFRRRSVRHFAYPLPKEALDPHDVSAKVEEMYCWIRKLSDLAFILSGQANRRQPLSECEVSQLESLTANQPFPTALDALRQLFGVSTLDDVRSRIRELSLEEIPYMQVVRAVASMTVYNVIFREDPFAHHAQTAWVITMLEQDPLYSEFSIITILMKRAKFEF
jgi:hypothetical protein